MELSSEQVLNNDERLESMYRKNKKEFKDYLKI